MILILDFYFSSAHFYEQKNWTTKKNRDEFGKCYSAHGHGHNYHLQLEVDIFENNPKIAKKEIQDSMKPLLDLFDHEHINFRIPYFENVVPTTENISLYIKAESQIPDPYRPLRLRLYEMDSIYVETSL